MSRQTRHRDARYDGATDRQVAETILADINFRNLPWENAVRVVEGHVRRLRTPVASENTPSAERGRASDDASLWGDGTFDGQPICSCSTPAHTHTVKAHEPSDDASSQTSTARGSYPLLPKEGA